MKGWINHYGTLNSKITQIYCENSGYRTLIYKMLGGRINFDKEMLNLSRLCLWCGKFHNLPLNEYHATKIKRDKEISPEQLFFFAAVNEDNAKNIYNNFKFLFFYDGRFIQPIIWGAICLMAKGKYTFIYKLFMRVHFWLSCLKYELYDWFFPEKRNKYNSGMIKGYSAYYWTSPPNIQKPDFLQHYDWKKIFISTHETDHLTEKLIKSGQSIL